MKTAQPAIGEPARQREAGGEVIGKAGVIGGGEGPAGAAGDGASGEAERSLGRDMERIGGESGEQGCEPAARPEGEADFGIDRAGEGPEPVRPDHQHPVSREAKLVRDHGEGADDAVDLRMPGVADDRDPPRHAGFLRRSRHSARCPAGRGRRGRGAPPSRAVPAARRDARPARCSFPPSPRR